LMNVSTDLKLPLVANSANWVKSYSERKRIRVEPVVVPGNVVPDLKGMGAKDAVYLAEKLGMNVQLYGYGKVIAQSLRPGFAVRKGTILKINLER